ncbi:MAG: MBL fold metallo-hydrolase [Phycisphaerales bacterium]|nr:MBL fold metallo-hydrolase [Phycisphaerales bacterium]
MNDLGSPPSVISADLRVIASGSAGNLSILTIERYDDPHPIHVCIDLGIGPRTLARRLDAHAPDIDLDHVRAVVVTHPDTDHLRPTWRRSLEARGWPVFAAPSHHAALARHGVPGRQLLPLSDGGRRVSVVKEILDVTIALGPHDDHGSAVLRFDLDTGHAPTTIGWATDIGRVTPQVRDLLAGCDFIGLESNYDPGLQSASNRPPFLKQRITGGHGHLSNHEAMAAIRAMTDRSRLEAIVLLHLSRDCNDPGIVRRLWDERETELAERLHIADQDLPLDPIRIFEATDRGTAGLLPYPGLTSGLAN